MNSNENKVRVSHLGGGETQETVMGITFGDHLIDSGYYDITPEQERERDLERHAAEAKEDNRTCTCHPDDRPEPCMRKFATSHCWRAAVHEEVRQGIVQLKGHDRNQQEQTLLNHLMRVERALDGTF